MSLSDKIHTMLFQLDIFAIGNKQAENSAKLVAEEWEKVLDAATYIKGDNRIQLNRVLHATRAFDTGLRLFLDKYSHRSNDSCSIASYIRDLQRNVNKRTGFRQLDGKFPPLIQKEITDKRNIYMHSSGKFPSKGEANYLISDILRYYTIVLGLAK
jgi:hypothetical protein